MLKCSICNREFKDSQLDEYAAHVQKCAADESLKRKTEDMKKINQELTELKKIKASYEKLRNNFKEKYPDIYKANFTDKCEGNCKCHSDKNNNSSNEKPLSSDKPSSKKPINKGNYDGDFEFEVDFSDLERVLNELFGFDYKKRN